MQKSIFVNRQLKELHAKIRPFLHADLLRDCMQKYLIFLFSHPLQFFYPSPVKIFQSSPPLLASSPLLNLSLPPSGRRQAGGGVTAIPFLIDDDDDDDEEATSSIHTPPDAATADDKEATAVVDVGRQASSCPYLATVARAVGGSAVGAAAVGADGGGFRDGDLPPPARIQQRRASSCLDRTAGTAVVGADGSGGSPPPAQIRRWQASSRNGSRGHDAGMRPT